MGQWCSSAQSLETSHERSSKHSILQSPRREKRKIKMGKRVSFFDFKGLMAPVFTCFKNDEHCSLEIEHIDQYARWLKANRINGVLVNGFSGEGSALGLEERKLNTEAWWRAANEYDLILMVQVGGAPLPDVLSLAEHADSLGVHAVVCLPELFYKPRSIDQLVAYCKIIAKKCNSRPFFYYHLPRFTGVYFDMAQFCHSAEENIANFFGVQYSDYDLGMAERCMEEGRVILLGSSSLVASAILQGFESVLVTVCNIYPDIIAEIFDAMQNQDLKRAKQIQRELNARVFHYTKNFTTFGYVAALKLWFNEKADRSGGPGFSVGPARQSFFQRLY